MRSASMPIPMRSSDWNSSKASSRVIIAVECVWSQNSRMPAGRRTAKTGRIQPGKPGTDSEFPANCAGNSCQSRSGRRRQAAASGSADGEQVRLQCLGEKIEGEQGCGIALAPTVDRPFHAQKPGIGVARKIGNDLVSAAVEFLRVKWAVN